MNTTHGNGVRTVREFKERYFPNLLQQEQDEASAPDLSYIKNLIAKTLKQNKK